jgi:hypothetical protein
MSECSVFAAPVVVWAKSCKAGFCLAHALPLVLPQVEAVDYAPRMMQHMAARAAPLQKNCVLQYAAMDAQRLGFRAGAFDTVVDKGDAESSRWVTLRALAG